jgi:hypothetical protein
LPVVDDVRTVPEREAAPLLCGHGIGETIGGALHRQGRLRHHRHPGVDIAVTGGHAREVQDRVDPLARRLALEAELSDLPLGQVVGAGEHAGAADVHLHVGDRAVEADPD